jgi:hypothetical protein
MDGEPISPPRRRRLPNRRKAIPQTLVIGSMVLSATVGFDEAASALGVAIDLLVECENARFAMPAAPPAQ